MSAPTWMPLDIDRYLADTFHLSATEHGAYMLLIMRYWKDGGLPEDERMIAKFARLTPEQWSESRDTLAAFFHNGWRHKRIDAELAKAADIIGKRRAAAEQRHSKPDANAVHVHSKSTYAGVPPSPSTITSSLRSEETRERASSPPGFDEFWSLYPNKVGRAAALKAFSKAAKSASVDAIMAGLHRYAAKTDDRPWCNPATWLNQGRWADQPAAVMPFARGSPPHRKPTLADGFAELSRIAGAENGRQGAKDFGGTYEALSDLSLVRGR